MKQIILILLFLLPYCAYSQNELSTITRVGENVYISAQIDDSHTIHYWFKKCMANDIFTFYRVSLAEYSTSITLNESTSDNVGPFEIKDGGWCGGNHLYLDTKTKTAKTTSVKLLSGSKYIESDTTFRANTIRIEVTNHIYNPVSALKSSGGTVIFTDTLCVEKVIYNICGNSIGVNVSHKYTNKIPVTILKYYGMQSMFIDEHSILSPLGKYKSWTQINMIDRFKKNEYPLFNRYIEKSKNGFQSSFLLDCNLGAHNDIKGDDYIFVGNSWSKSYHKLIAHANRITGNEDSWSGVYTWFATPILDTDSAFSYSGVINGKYAIFFSNNKKGRYVIPLNKIHKNSSMSIFENKSGIKIAQKKNSLYMDCCEAGSAIILY